MHTDSSRNPYYRIAVLFHFLKHAPADFKNCQFWPAFVDALSTLG